MRKLLKIFITISAFLLFISGITYAATLLQPFQGGTGIGSYTAGDILYSDATDSLAKLSIGADDKVLKLSGGLPTWQTDATGAGGSPVVLDLADDGSDESTDLTEIATTGDTNAIFSEPSADKLLIDLSKDWPKADTADDLTCTNCIGGTEIAELTDADISNTLTCSTCTGNAATVTNATFTTALTVDTGTVGLTGNVANNSVLTIGAGAVSVSGSNTGDDDVPDAGDFGAATDLDANGAVAWGNIAEGELANNTIISADIKDGVLLEADLKAVDAASDEDIFTYESTTGDFEWHTGAELGIGTATSITDDLIIPADFAHSQDYGDFTIGAGGSFTLDTGTVSDNEIDYATVNMDDMTDGSTNAAITLAQETNFETAYTHSQDNSQAHSDYLTNNAADTMAGALTINPGTLFIQEQADADADVAGKGQIWVNTATPNELWFTDDAGTDVQLGTGGGDITDVFDCSTGDCNTMTVGTSEYLTYGTGYIDANRFAGVTTVDGTEFGYLNGVTSGIQTQFAGKEGTLTNSAGLLAALNDETGTGVAVFSTSPTLVTPALGTPSALVGTNISGTAANLTAGTVTTNANLTGEVTSIGNATTIADSITVTGWTMGASVATTPAANDNDTSIATSAFVQTELDNEVRSKAFTILDPIATDDYPVWKSPVAITITAVHVQCLGGTNIVGQLTECDAEGINCAVCDSADITAAANNSEDDDGTLSNPSIDALDYVGWKTESISGTPTSVTVTFEFTIN